MNVAVKRAHDETKVMENSKPLQQQGGGQQQQQQQNQQQQHQQLMMVDAAGGENAAETRPSKVARHEREQGESKQGHEAIPVFHKREGAASLELGGGGVRGEVAAIGLGRESKQMKVQQQQQQQHQQHQHQHQHQLRDFSEDKEFLNDEKIKHDVAQGMRVSGKGLGEEGMDLSMEGGSVEIRSMKVQQQQESSRGFVQEATEGGGGNIVGPIPEVLTTRKSPLEQQEGKLWELQEASGENKVDGGKKEEREKEEKKEKMTEEKAPRERNDRKLETTTHLVQQQQQHPNLLEQKGPERDEKERDREKIEKEKDKDKVLREKSSFWGRDKGKGTHGDKRDKRDKEEDKEQLNHRKEQQLLHVDQEERGGGEKEEMMINAIIKDQELDRTSRGDIEERKPIIAKEGRETTREREREKEREEEVVDGEKQRKRMWEAEKDRQSGGRGSPNGEATMGERHKDRDTSVVNHNVQQRKRLLRPRGHSTPATRELRSHPTIKETEGTMQGRSESSALLYRIGEGMPELTKLRKDYDAKNAATVATESNIPSNVGLTVEIRIPADLATTSNRQIRGRQLWGTDVYTDDSDIVAVLMHTGYYTPTATPPPHSVSELQATIQILPPQETYTSMLRNSLRSRAWGGGSGCSYRVESCRIIKTGGGSIELEPCLTRTPAVAPTLAPAASERTVTTRAACSNAYLQQRLVREVTIQYNLCNEPWLKYSMSIVADRGLKKSQYTSARLKKGDVLYVETHRHRYELAYSGNGATCNGATAGVATATSAPPQPSGAPEKTKEKVGSSERAPGKGYGAHNGEKAHPDSHAHNGEKSCQGHGTKPHNGDSCERYRWSRCKRPLPLSSMRITGIPSPPDNVEVLQDRLAWEEVKWSPTSVWVRGTEYPLARAQFLSPHVEDSDD